MSRLPSRMWCVAILAASSLALAGCGPDYKARGSVKGKVTFGKKALTTGSVMFINKNGITASAGIDAQGNYEMNDAPVGECQVTVTVPATPNDPSIRARMKGAGPKMPEMKGAPDGDGPPPPPSGAVVPKEIVQIDAKYSKPDTSGLKFDVKKGEQTFNIEL